MAVYVDDYEGKFGRMIMCHMMADTLDELHAMADFLMLKREWFQTGGGAHYDVSKSIRSLAIACGVKELPIRIDGRGNPEWKRVVALAREQAKNLKA